MRMRHRLVLLGLLGAAIFGAGAAVATGSIQIGPTITTMIGKERTATVTIRNSDASPVTVQIRTMDWTQKDGQDVHTSSKTLVASPPFATLQPNEAQTVRLLISNVSSVKSERAFRLFIDEVPNAAVKPNTGLQTTLRILSPVFLAPSTESRPRMKWSSARVGNDAVLTARNDGDAHERLSEVRISAGDKVIAEGAAFGGYVLAGGSRSWTVPAGAGGDIVVSGVGEFGPVNARVAIAH